MAKLSLGIDCGSTTVKGVLFDGEKVVDSRLVATSARPALRMHEIYEKLWNEDVGYVVTTGYGRELLPEANKKVTEITCHAKGRPARIVKRVGHCLNQALSEIVEPVKMPATRRRTERPYRP